jgi:hypothetical protein
MTRTFTTLIAVAATIAFYTATTVAQIYTPAPYAEIQFFDSNGDPLNGGLLNTYSTGTTNRLATYTDATGATTNANPVVLDSAGRAAVFISSANNYRFVLTDSTGTSIWTVDGVRFAAVDQVIGTSNQIAVSSNTGSVTFTLTGPFNYTSQTQNAVLYGNGTGAIAATTASGASMVLIGKSGESPQFSNTPTIVALQLSGIAFASLTALSETDGQVRYCSDCIRSTTCAGSGTGSLATLLSGIWACD